MKISELSRRSGVPIPTIKYYLRDGLLPPGHATAANQAVYDEDHLRRLRLIRTLISVRQLSVGATKEILSAVTHEGDLHQILGIVINARPADLKAKEKQSPQAAPPGAADALRLVAEMGWDVNEETSAIGELGGILDALADLGAGIDWRTLLPYAELVDKMSTLDLEQLNGRSGPLERAERAVVVSVLLEPALLAMRRLAQEDKSGRMFQAAAAGQEEHTGPERCNRRKTAPEEREGGAESG
ncbi:MerR family transcriptional regulator [Streptomyces sp. NPDC056112]|uniref:MerR family transcriptional regulator n=1 Tax=unclassified Streptomyces TaxID=2593676 RepID=UPI002480095A|nr:MerR family transcriptional regulator [Streptomyces sp. HYC2]